MTDKRENPNRESKDVDQRESGLPGGGQGRIDEPGHTGVYPGSGPFPPGEAPIVTPGSWGQGDRGPEGYYDAGDWSPETIENIRREAENEEQAESPPRSEKPQPPKSS